MEQLNPLFEFINQRVKLLDSDKIQITNIARVESFSKGDQLVRLDQTCKTLRFVLSGIYRVYKIEEGKEITSYFNYAQRNPFVAAFVSLLSNSPSNEIVECVESGETISFDYNDWKNLYAQSNRLNTFGRLMAEFNYLLAIERIESLQYKDAIDRYTAFIILYPNLLNLVPHHYIASYLGITPESLSRIRRNALRT